MVTEKSTQNQKQLLLSLDPGKQTGIALGTYGDEAYELLNVWQVAGGLEGFIDWWHEHYPLNESVLVSEKFVLRNNAFVADTEPLLIEGALRVLYDANIVWQLPSDKSLVADTVLRENQLWHTGKQVGWKDARDTNDAIIHGLAYLKKNKHIPTLQKYWGKD